MDDFFLQLFLAINLVILGVVTTLTIQYWRRHLHPKKEEPSPKPKKESPLSPQDKDRMARELEKHFQDILNRSVEERAVQFP
jgi:hypothetical protein